MHVETDIAVQLQIAANNAEKFVPFWARPLVEDVYRRIKDLLRSNQY
jgi:hypothetical protein